MKPYFRKKDRGKWLEKLIENYQSGGMMLIRLRDSSDFGGHHAFDYNRNPGDFIGHIQGHPLLLDCKETIKDRIHRSDIVKKKSPHQYESMLRWAASHPRNLAGYLVHLGGAYLIVWVPVAAIEHLTVVSDESIGHFGIRSVDLRAGRVDWNYLFLGGN